MRLDIAGAPRYSARPRAARSIAQGKSMASRVTVRALFSEHPDAICKALRELARGLGADSVHDRRPEDYDDKRAAFAEHDCEARLLELSRNDDDAVRELAADALGVWGGEAARERLIKLCQDPVVEVRASAAGALEHWPDDREVAEVLLIAADDSKWIVRMQATRALRGFPGSDVDRALMTSLLDPDSFVRTTAADALAVRPAEQVLPHLRKLFDHPAPHTFDAAFELAGRIGTAEDGVFLARVGRFTNWSQPAEVKRWARDAARAIRARLKTS